MSKKTLRLPVIDSRIYQLPFWRAMDGGAKRAVKAWHRRAGKDITDFQFVVRQAMKRKGTYYYYFPTLELAKKALWDNIVEFYSNGECIAAGNMIDILCPPEIRSAKNNTDHFIRLTNGSIIKLGGTDNLSVIGMNGYGYVFSEWQSQKKEAFGYISPILRENGGWALFNGTMRGKHNHLYQDVMRNKDNPVWFTQWIKPEHTKDYYWVNEGEGICVNPELAGMNHIHTLRPYDNIQDLVDAGEISFTLARQEYLNDAVSQVGGSYYDYEIDAMQNRGGVKPLDPFRDVVYTFWDLGGDKETADKTAIVFAQMNSNDGKLKVVDYYENSGHLRGHYIEVVNAKGYTYGGHYMPHDAKRSNAWTGESSAETALNEYGMEIRFVPKTQSVSNDIELVRRDISQWEVDSNRCDEFMQHMSNYHEREATGKPCHVNSCNLCRGASHGADTGRTMVMARYQKLVEPYLVNGTTTRHKEAERIDDEWICV